jgi:hypothetical protein
MKITLTNDFHGTSVNLIAKRDDISRDLYYLSARQIRRAREALCSSSGCRCGDDVGARGWQRYQVVVERDWRGGEMVTTGTVYDTASLY